MNQQAVEAVAEALCPGIFSLSDHHYALRYDNNPALRAQHQTAVLEDARNALEAARPHIEAELLEKIIKDFDSTSFYRYADGSEGHFLQAHQSKAVRDRLHTYTEES